MTYEPCAQAKMPPISKDMCQKLAENWNVLQMKLKLCLSYAFCLSRIS